MVLSHAHCSGLKSGMSSCGLRASDAGNGNSVISYGGWPEAALSELLITFELDPMRVSFNPHNPCSRKPRLRKERISLQNNLISHCVQETY